MNRPIVVLLVVLAILSAGVIEWESAKYRAPGPGAANGEETVVVIKSGAGLRGIAETLADAHVITGNPLIFEIAVWLRGKTSLLKAGEYAIPSHANEAAIVDILAAGKSIKHKLTAAEGLTSQMIYDLVQGNTVLMGPSGAVPAEGTLLPETYLFTLGTTRARILAEMKKAQADLLARLWPERAPQMFLPPEQAITLASIVEKESAIPEERRHIAAVFLNRLRLGMKLQSDPTIIYDISKGYPLGRGIRQSEIVAATPYNTYAITGLPPGPICNPGKDSIEAVLNPETSDDLYFVANGTGGHVFSTTIQAHNKNVASWRKIEKKHKRK